MEREFAQLIHAAIFQKYGERSLREVRAIVARSLDEFAHAPSESALLRHQEITTAFTSDIINQTRCLYCIETYWRHRTPRRGFVKRVHAISCGSGVRNVQSRTRAYVEDYGDVAWPLNDIGRGLRGIAAELGRLSELRNASVTEKGEFLASVFAGIIRVHPFRDGNGRTSRMLVEYCLRFWSDDYVVVPKVRNSERWRIVVEEAVGGRLGQLSRFFEQRIDRRPP